MGTIHIVEDKYIERVIDRNFIVPTFKFRLPVRKAKAKETIRIAPHCGENWATVDLLRFKLYCELNKIKVIAYGNLNQLPFLSIIADELMLDKAPGLDRLYTGMSINGNRRYKADNLKNYVETHAFESDFVKKAIENISDDEVVDRFANYDVFIRKSTFDLFKYLNLPRDLVIAETKWGGDTVLEKFPSVIGIDKVFQSDLIQRVDNHYMGMQILGSQLLNWVYFSSGGSGNLFCIIPIKYLTYFDVLATESTARLVRLMSIKRYGEIGHRYPIVGQWGETDQFELLDFKDMQKVIQQIREREPPVLFAEYKHMLVNQKIVAMI